MTEVLLAGTDTGVHLVDEQRTVEVGGPVTALAADDKLWCVAGETTVASSPDG